MPLKMSHLFGGILGGVAFGLAAGLLLGSCVFEGGPNHAATAPGAARAAAAEPAEGMPSGGGAVAAAPGGMDPGGGAMESVFARVANLKKALAANPSDRGALIELGNLYYDANKFDQAASYYEKAVALD